MKTLRVLLTVLVLILALAGCASSESNGSAQDEQTSTKKQANNSQSKGEKRDSKQSDANLLEKIKAEGKIRIGTEGTYRPYTFHDNAGKLTGFDVEISEEIAKRLGVSAEFMETQWDGMFAGLDAKRFDIIVNQVGIRPDREKKYDFSHPYSVSAGSLVVHKDNETVQSFNDVKGLKAGQSLTSNWTDIARELGAEIVATDGFNQAIELLANKRIDVTINDGLSILDYLQQHPDAPVKIVAKHEEQSKSGVTFRKGNRDLVEAVNKALDEMKADGTYQKISEKWFGTDVSN